MSDDTIYRQAAIDAVGANTLAGSRIRKLPSAQRTGRWIFETLDGVPGYRPTVMFCSKCGRVSIADYSYCPNCGARMEEQE